MPISESRSHRALTPSVKFLNGEVHDWYRMVLGYPDHLVASLFDRLSVDSDSRLLDPFCGSGTTLVESMKRSVKSAAGIDANPVAVMVSRAKTDWTLDPDRLTEIAERVAERAKGFYERDPLTTDPTYVYLDQSGMLRRGWISRKPLRKAVAIKRSLGSDRATQRYKDLLRLCLMTEVVRHASNVKFGPEIYCSKKKRDVAVFSGFLKRVRQASSDLKKVNLIAPSAPRIVEGDARRSSRLLQGRTFTHCICSPPYPTEHDYTRNSRLELAFLERGIDRESLQAIKKAMIRSHTKNIYKGDRDYDHAKRHTSINRLVAQLRREVGDAHGFVGYYPDVIAQYFGGMKRHFGDLKKLLAPGAQCAYVVGDQSSYCGIHIPTAKLLGVLLDSLGFVDIDIVHWRGRWSSATSVMVDENVLLFSKDSRRA